MTISLHTRHIPTVVVSRSQSAPSCPPLVPLVPLSTVIRWLIYSSEGGGVHGGAPRQRVRPNPAMRGGGVGPRH